MTRKYIKNKIVKAALNLDTHSLHYNVTLNPVEALEFAKNCGNYNKASMDNLETLINKCGVLIPPMQFPGDNPNNGRTHHNFKVGREYSRVLYLDVVKAYLPFDFDYAKLEQQLKRCAEIAEADEFSITENTTELLSEKDITGAFVVRFWWD